MIFWVIDRRSTVSELNFTNQWQKISTWGGDCYSCSQRNISEGRSKLAFYFDHIFTIRSTQKTVESLFNFFRCIKLLATSNSILKFELSLYFVTFGFSFIFHQFGCYSWHITLKISFEAITKVSKSSLDRYDEARSKHFPLKTYTSSSFIRIVPMHFNNRPLNIIYLLQEFLVNFSF